MKRILYLGGFEMPDKNAAAHRVLANALTLKELGYEVLFIGPTKNHTNIVEEFCGFKCEYIDYPKSLWQWFKYITTFVSTQKILEYKPDYVILYNFPAFASLKILRTCHKKGIKVIHDLTEWESSNNYSLRGIVRKIDINIRMHYCMKKMDGVIAISRYLYEYYSRFTKTILVPPTIDLTNPKFNRDRILKVNTPLQLVFAGTNGGGIKERLDYIIDSVCNENSLKLTIVGLTTEQYQKIYGSLPKNCNNVVFKGRVSHQEAVNIVSNSDFQMLIRENTLKNKAGFPTKFVESMSCCTPLIATETSNICDYLIDGKNGFIVKDYKHLKETIKRLLQMESNEINKMKESCRDFIGFDYRNYIEEFSKLFI